MSVNQTIKDYLRVSGTDEDTLIIALETAAHEYLENIGIPAAANSTKELYLLAVKFLVAHWFDNRNTVIVGTISKELEFTLTAITTQLYLKQATLL